MFEPWHKNLITGSALAVLFSIEYVIPYMPSWKFKLRHALRNGTIMLGNNLLLNLLFVPLIVVATNTTWGVFHQVQLDWYVELMLTILIIDLLAYVIHFFSHTIPILWRFHKVHHSDTQMDVTSAGRFHIGEHIYSVLMRIILYALFGMKLEFILIYETIFLINVMFHHANISISPLGDRVWRVFFTSPDMHKVHHSDVMKETNSNYTSLFSFWDRVFGTFRIVENPKGIVYGIHGLEKKQSVKSMLVTPFE